MSKREKRLQGFYIPAPGLEREHIGDTPNRFRRGRPSRRRNLSAEGHGTRKAFLLSR